MMEADQNACVRTTSDDHANRLMAQVQDLMMEAGKLLEIHRAILHHADDLMEEAAKIKSASA